MDKDFLEKLKNKIKTSDVLSDSEKQEWLFLLPKMNDEQLFDLERLTSIHLKKSEPKPVVPPREATNPGPSITSKNTINTISPISPTDVDESDQSRQSVAPNFIKPIPSKPKEPSEKGVSAPSPKLNLSIDLEKLKEDLKTTNDFPFDKTENVKKATPSVAPEHSRPEQINKSEPKPLVKSEAKNERNAPSAAEFSLSALKKSSSIHSYLESLKKDMSEDVSSGKSNWRKKLSEYEKSELYQSYLKSGVVLLSGQKSSDLDLEQFEALADFHAELRKMV